MFLLVCHMGRYAWQRMRILDREGEAVIARSSEHQGLLNILTKPCRATVKCVIRRGLTTVSTTRPFTIAPWEYWWYGKSDRRGTKLPRCEGTSSMAQVLGALRGRCRDTSNFTQSEWILIPPGSILISRSRGRMCRRDSWCTIVIARSVEIS